MADDAAPDAANKGEGQPPKPPSPLVPIILIVLLVPGLTFGISQFVILPKMKSMVEETVSTALSENAQSSKGGKGGGPRDAAHNEAVPMQTYEFQDIVTNISSGIQARYIRVSFTIEGDDPRFVELADTNRTKLVDTALGILSALQWEEVQKAGTKNLVRNDLINAFNTALHGELVKNLYFAQFVVQ